MRGAARAIAWEFQLRHRLALAGCLVYLAGFWIVKALVLGPDVAMRWGPPNALGGLLIGPLQITYFFCLGIFSYGFDGDMGARESVFPRRMFTLPVSTFALAGWPMLYGATCAATLWLVTVLLIRWTGGVGMEVPWIWPAIMAATYVVWIQALTWFAYPLRGLRIAIAVLVLSSFSLTIILALEFHARESTMIAILAPQLLIACGLAFVAVARARRGVTPGWSAAIGPRPAPGRQALAAHFSSPSRAQAWLEWRQHGRTLPLLVTYVVPCELVLLFLPGNDRTGIIFFILFVALITPPAMAMLAAPALSTFSTHAATRPLTNMALIAAKIRMTAWSTLVAWALVTVYITCALFLSGAMPVAVEKLRDLAEIAGSLRATLLVLIVFAALVLSTWKNLVQSLCIGLSGRPWLIKLSVLAALILVSVAFPALWLLVMNDRVQSFVWESLVWILAALVVLKASAGAWVAIRLHDRRVLSDRALVIGAVTWLVAVVAVFGLLRWIVASPIYPFYGLGAIAILMVPLARLAAAPLALASSRHR